MTMSGHRLAFILFSIIHNAARFKSHSTSTWLVAERVSAKKSDFGVTFRSVGSDTSECSSSEGMHLELNYKHP